MSAPLAPGAYLRRRREAAGLALESVARLLLAMPMARPASVSDRAALTVRLAEGEAGTLPFTAPQVELLRSCFAFDPGVHAALVALASAPLGHRLPEPQLCRVCACSWHDACLTDHGPCTWSPGAPDLCTACERAHSAGTEFVAHPPAWPAAWASLPEGIAA